MAEALAQQRDPNRRSWRDLRLLRIAGAVLIAACPLGLLVAILITQGEVDLLGHGFPALGFFYLVALVWLGISTGIHLGVVRIRGQVTRRQCLIWNVVTSFLPPLLLEALVRVAEVVDGGRIDWLEDLGGIAFRLALFVAVGVLNGWIYWRIGIRPATSSGNGAAARLDAGAAVSCRQWRDLRAGRLSLALCLGPIVMTGLLIPIWILGASMTPQEMTYSAVATLIVATVWCLVGGWAYLLAVVRRRRKIGRLECVLFGLILANLFPLILFFFIFTMEGWQGITGLIDDPEVDTTAYLVAIFITLEVLFAVMGLLHGWLFWRVGVRPAALPEPDVTGVFD